MAASFKGKKIEEIYEVLGQLIDDGKTDDFFSVWSQLSKWIDSGDSNATFKLNEILNYSPEEYFSCGWEPLLCKASARKNEKIVQFLIDNKVC